MKTMGRYVVLLVACAICMQSQSQQTKNPLQLADQYFASGEYYTAAHLYEQFLNPPRQQKTAYNFPLNSLGKRKPAATRRISQADILFKQAESYRLANYWQEAATSYKKCGDKDPVQYPHALYWYAVCQRSLANYSEAEESLRQFVASAGENREYKNAADNEIQTLQYIRQQLARPDSILIKTRKLNALNGSERGVFAPAHVGGNQFVVTSTQTDSVQTKGVNPYHSRLFYATLHDGSLEGVTPLAISTPDQTNHQGAASISADGKYLYFSQWKKEGRRTVSTIYYAVKEGESWGLPVLLSSINIDGYSSKQPFCSPDGKYLFFASDRRDGLGNFDIWYAILQKDGTTGKPVNAGPVINTNGDEQAPFYHQSSRSLVFSSNGRPGMGGYDLFAAKGNDETWMLPENLGHPVNSSRDDVYFFAREKSPLLSNAVFSSDRGTGCCLETYSISKAPKSKRLEGILRDCKDNTPVANAEVILKDASKKVGVATTDADGKYVFNLGTTFQDLTLSIKKDLYQEATSSYQIERIDESDLLTDVLLNASLCIEKTPVIVTEDTILVIKPEDVITIYFDFDRSILNTASIKQLDSIYTVMVQYPTATIQISGYTDGLGSAQYNQILSDKRARACGDYLIKKGIEASRVTFVSFGSCCPVEMEIINGRDNSGGRSRNRRALINMKKE